ncbi:MAG: hypothetical protein HKN43_09495 [Rhodothermales bacterium]|nr:hypothetical protein [Rhodothermales bacterium]
MKYAFLSTLFLSLLLFTGCKSSEPATEAMADAMPEPSMEETLITEHISARGGMETLSGITSVKTTGEVLMPAMDMTMLMTNFQKAPGKLRLEVDVPQMGAKIVNGYNGETAWESNPMAGGAAKLGGDRARAFREQADMDGYLVSTAEDGYEITYEGDEEVEGALNHKMRVMRPDSTDLFVYLNAETKLETLIEAQAPNPMTGAMTTVQTFYSDYRNVGGTPMPYRIEVMIGGEVFQTVTFSDIRVNVPMNDSIFEFPGE